MSAPSIDKLRDELTRLMRQHIETMKNRTFLGITPEELSHEKEQLQRIREVSAEFLEALRKISR